MRLGPYELGPTDDEHQGVYTGDARELAKAIPDESVDLIFTDPVYLNIEDYYWLARTASRVLKSDRACLVWCGIGYLDDTLKALADGGLSYRWLLVTRVVARVKYQRCDAGNNCWMCLLWTEKGRMKARQSSDLVTVPYRESRIEVPNKWLWGKPIKPTLKWLEAFSKQGDVVLDFFGGLGTTAVACILDSRQYLLFEQSSDRAQIARQRVRNTQPPLFVPEPEQLELEGVQ